MLTDSQKRDAERQYRRSKLDGDELLHLKVLEKFKAELEAAKENFQEAQNKCPHPLIMRDYENKGCSGNWDDPEGSYWTQHHCTMCDMRWRTTQDWCRKGTKLGLPDDEQVKDY